jgi:hypothetical protein
MVVEAEAVVANSVHYYSHHSRYFVAVVASENHAGVE